jgi:hypothetical protein
VASRVEGSLEGLPLALVGYKWPQDVVGGLGGLWVVSGVLGGLGGHGWSRGVLGHLRVAGGLGVSWVAAGGCKCLHMAAGGRGGPDFRTSVTFVVKYLVEQPGNIF